MKFQYNDGGRAAAGFKGDAGDCVCRSIAIVSGKAYKEIYEVLAKGNASQRKTKRSSRVTGKETAAHGISVRRKWFKDYMKSLGFEWVPTMKIGQGCKVHLRDGELPMGKLIVAVSKHYTSVIDGVIHDTHNPCREGGSWIQVKNGIETSGTSGGRCVYGYFKLVE